MADSRPPIPPDIKREVRKRCGFGCVICGNPIFDYDHIEQYAITKRHVAAELTLLCPLHHRKKTGKKLPRWKVLMHNDKPFNLNSKFTTGDELYFGGNEVHIILAENIFSIEDSGSGTFLIPIIIKKEFPIAVKLKDNEIFLNIILKDQDDNAILLVEDNELKVATGIWDIEYLANTLIIRQASRNIFIEIKFDFEIPNKVHLIKGNIYCGGGRFKLNNNKGMVFTIEGVNVKWKSINGKISNSNIGINIDYEATVNSAMFLQIPK